MVEVLAPIRSAAEAVGGRLLAGLPVGVLESGGYLAGQQVGDDRLGRGLDLRQGGVVAGPQGTGSGGGHLASFYGSFHTIGQAIGEFSQELLKVVAQVEPMHSAWLHDPQFIKVVIVAGIQE